MTGIIFDNYNYLRNISVSQSVRYEINMMNFIKADRIVTLELFALCEKLFEIREGCGL